MPVFLYLKIPCQDWAEISFPQLYYDQHYILWIQVSDPTLSTQSTDFSTGDAKVYKSHFFPMEFVNLISGTMQFFRQFYGVAAYWQHTLDVEGVE
ncbi:hypothetical protein ATN88_14485 [Enterovibrio coralii]|uniref:Uncharacterized protein n=1 Tax=Enterovibrio coralii TaxID=294935 RepID=A0A135IB58_9GAMM|nr:hypothetical protein ATN88_14485 [Enterovibrio coralii]